MNNSWYEIVDAGKPLTQGDIIFNCPIINCDPNKLNLKGSLESEILTNAVACMATDVVVMTQACDLENNKVANVILCPHLPIDEYSHSWETEMRQHSQNPTTKAWKSYCKDLCDGFLWNLTMLNNCQTEKLSIDIRIVDFSEIFTLPRQFLELLLTQRAEPRFRLLPPYREHLSQAFARFFMRVGLPISIQPPS